MYLTNKKWAILGAFILIMIFLIYFTTFINFYILKFVGIELPPIENGDEGGIVNGGDDIGSVLGDDGQGFSPPTTGEILNFPDQHVEYSSDPEKGEESVNIVSPGETVNLPPSGLSIQLEENVILALYPTKRFTAKIYNISKIRPAQYKILLCNQISLASYEINVSADLAFFCVNYSNYILNVTEPTVSVFKFNASDWIDLGPQKIIKNTTSKIICGNISSTPYMVAGNLNVPESQEALEKLQIAGIAVRESNSSEVAEIFTLASDLYNSCQYSTAIQLAEKAIDIVTLSRLPKLPIELVVLIILAGIAVKLQYNRLLKRVRHKRSKR